MARCDAASGRTSWSRDDAGPQHPARRRLVQREPGRAAGRARVDELVVVGGPPAEGLVDGAVAGGLSTARIHRYADSASAADDVARLVTTGDLVLVKGSRGTRTDIIADRLARAAEGA